MFLCGNTVRFWGVAQIPLGLSPNNTKPSVIILSKFWKLWIPRLALAKALAVAQCTQETNAETCSHQPSVTGWWRRDSSSVALTQSLGQSVDCDLAASQPLGQCADEDAGVTRPLAGGPLGERWDRALTELSVWLHGETKGSGFAENRGAVTAAGFPSCSQTTPHTLLTPPSVKTFLGTHAGIWILMKLSYMHITLLFCHVPHKTRPKIEIRGWAKDVIIQTLSFFCWWYKSLLLHKLAYFLKLI